MAPKHELPFPQPHSSDVEQLSERSESSETSMSRSQTPADTTGKVEFEIKYPVMNSKKKRSKKEEEYVSTAEHQVSPFVAKGASKEGELDQYYSVVPAKEWAAMKCYKNFVIQGEDFQNDQFVYVRGAHTDAVYARANGVIGETVERNYWIARILQVRAKNSQHVYALVAWLYWPDELPAPPVKTPDQVSKASGRRTYHGAHELVASNYMEVLDVLSFAGRADVLHWEEDDDNLQTKLYWRQTFCRETQKLSKIREHCICNGHFNPEGEGMYICDNPTCKIWLHKPCLIDAVLAKAYGELVDSKALLNGSGKKSKRKSYNGLFEAEILEDEGVPPMIKITDLRLDSDVKPWKERLICLKCNVPLE